MSTVATMPLRELLSNYRDGDEHGWGVEFQWLIREHHEILNHLMRSIDAEGIREPVLLGDDGRVWDGHHRLCAAWILGLPDVPVRLSTSERAA